MTTAIASRDTGQRLAALAKLAAAKRAEFDELSQRTYLEDLAEVALWELQEACEALRHRSGWFPRSDEILAEVTQQRGRRPASPDWLTRQWQSECRTCEDTGFAARVCDVTARCGRRSCAQAGPEQTHTYRAICSCRATNHTYQRRHGLAPTERSA